VLVPELVVRNPEHAGAMLRRFGFAPDAGLWRLGSQALRLVVELSSDQPVGLGRGHGRIDHVALAVPDMDSAIAALLDAGLGLADDVTPNGPEIVPEFWGAGLRFVYLSGPEGARIELCQRLSGSVAQTGQDHIGIPCHDLPAMQRFFQGLGARLVATFDLDRPEGRIPVAFLAFEGGVIELYQPNTPARAARGLWSRLLVRGLPTRLDGPEDLHLAPL
jgi:catechol 2,3-dioxygenase-like lactoylglutathione lyase family enzyme